MKTTAQVSRSRLLSYGPLFALLLALPALTASGQSLMHRVIMKGNVLEASEAGIYLCIGTEDGATVGQELDVIRIRRDTTSPPKSGAARFIRQQTGRVRITEIVDEHYAKAVVIDGKAEEGSIVELRSAQ